jgi:hypothetical protein
MNTNYMESFKYDDAEVLGISVRKIQYKVQEYGGAAKAKARARQSTVTAPTSPMHRLYWVSSKRVRTIW